MLHQPVSNVGCTMRNGFLIYHFETKYNTALSKLVRSSNLNFYLFTQHDMEAKTKSHQENKHQQSKLTNFKEYLSEHHKEYAKREWKLF